MLIETRRPGSRLPRSCQSARGREHGFDAIAETPKFPDHLRSAALRPVFGDRRSAFLVRDAVVEDLPHQAAEPWAIAPIAWACPSRTTKRRYTSSKILPLAFTAALAVSTGTVADCHSAPDGCD